MSGTSGLPPLQAYLSYSANEAKYANADAQANPQETQLINYFQANAASITSPNQLLGNYKALSVVLGAFRLSGSINDTALLRQLMTQDPSAKNSTAQRMANAQYLSFANAMSNWNPPPFSSPAGIKSIITAYKNNQFEANAETQTPGLQNALYFTRMAGSITSVTQLQSDPSLLAVAVVGIGLPLTAYDNLSFTQQTTLLKQKLNLADLQKPSYVQRLAELYVAQKQLDTPLTPQAPAAGSLLSLFSPNTGQNAANGMLSILESSSGTTSSLIGTSSANSNILSLFA
ncbi:MAG TPA: DUF1217 domain-containing protein [Acetobacteraceae bacterium]|nr:DUF1217 domain-containing protein [Acetobacteraceae bacterium]